MVSRKRLINPPATPHISPEGDPVLYDPPPGGSRGEVRFGGFPLYSVVNREGEFRNGKFYVLRPHFPTVRPWR